MLPPAKGGHHPFFWPRCCAPMCSTFPPPPAERKPALSPCTFCWDYTGGGRRAPRLLGVSRGEWSLQKECQLELGENPSLPEKTFYKVSRLSPLSVPRMIPLRSNGRKSGIIYFLMSSLEYPTPGFYFEEKERAALKKNLV